MSIEVKICENCNHKNAITAVECEQCGYDLTFVFPQKIEDSDLESTKETGGWEMVSVTEEACRSCLDGEVTVGRDCELFQELFHSSNYTSRTHAKLRVVDDVVQVMDASTNGTFVNEKRIPKLEWVSVDKDSTIRFANVSFRIRRIQDAD